MERGVPRVEPEGRSWAHLVMCRDAPVHTSMLTVCGSCWSVGSRQDQHRPQGVKSGRPLSVPGLDVGLPWGLLLVSYPLGRSDSGGPGRT